MILQVSLYIPVISTWQLTGFDEICDCTLMHSELEHPRAPNVILHEKHTALISSCKHFMRKYSMLSLYLSMTVEQFGLYHVIKNNKSVMCQTLYNIVVYFYMVLYTRNIVHCVILLD